MSEANPDAEPATDPEWRESLLSIMRKVIESLPSSTSLGEIVEAAKANPAIEPVLETITVQELIDMAVAKPDTPAPDDEDPEALELDPSGGIIRRRADVPDGDMIMLASLAEHGPQSESQLARTTGLTSEQVRLILRQLRSKSYVHIEGSGAKRKIKITRNGGGVLRKRRNRRQRSRR